MLCWGIVVSGVETSHGAASCLAVTFGSRLCFHVLPLSRHCLFTLQGTYALNSNKGKRERIGRIQLMHANNREDIKVCVSKSFVLENREMTDT